MLIAAERRRPALERALSRQGHVAITAKLDAAVDVIDDSVDAVIVAAPRTAALALSARLKTRFQVPLLPVIALAPRPKTLPQEAAAPDTWLSPSARPGSVAERVEELVRIRRTERELVRLNASLVELAAENGRLYDRARRDAEATTMLLRELQHRVRNNLSAMQALLILERHRVPPRSLSEAIDVAVARLRSMAALQMLMQPESSGVSVASLATAIARSVIEVFGAGAATRINVRGDAEVAPAQASAIGVVLNELLTNVVRHAQAEQATVEIDQAADHVHILVEDSGRGIEDPAPGNGLTIAAAVTRNELRGELRREAIDRGTRFSLRIPAPH